MDQKLFSKMLVARDRPQDLNLRVSRQSKIRSYPTSIYRGLMEISINNPRVHDDELAKIKKNDRTLKLWTQSHMSHINAYRGHSIGGQGLVLAIPKNENIDLVEALESGRETWVEVIARSYGVEFRGYHVSQEELDRSLQKERNDFLQEISKPYHPKKEMKAYAKTVGDMPFRAGMILELIPSDEDSYIRTLGHPVSFVCSDLQQPILLTHGKTTTKKIIRAILTGYGASALVVLPYSNKSLILDDGELKNHHGAEIAVSFTLRR